jgi:hypothetical protein
MTMDHDLAASLRFPETDVLLDYGGRFFDRAQRVVNGVHDDDLLQPAQIAAARVPC